MVERGLGNYQIKKSIRAEKAILSILSDGEFHRYNEIVKRTGLSTATVTKHLKKLEKEGFVIKRIDLESNEYPYPVFYRLTAKGEAFKEKELFKDEIDRMNLVELKVSEDDIEEVAKLFLAKPLYEKIMKKISSRGIPRINKFGEMVLLLTDFMAKYNASLCSIRFLIPKGTTIPVLKRDMIFSLYETLLVCGVFNRKHPTHIIMSYNPEFDPEKIRKEIMEFYSRKGFKKDDVLRFLRFISQYI